VAAQQIIEAALLSVQQNNWVTIERNYQ
jgi:hypothetical protein